MPVYQLHCPSIFSLKETVESHGWFELEPWRWDGEFLSRKDTVGTWHGTITVQQVSGYELRVYTDSEAPIEILGLVNRWLSIDWDTTAFQSLVTQINPSIAAFLNAGGGRLLRGSCFYEDLVKTICTINTKWFQTRKMLERLVEIGGGYFPSPKLLLDFGFQQIGDRCKLGFRAHTLENAIQSLMVTGKLFPDGTADESRISYSDLIEIKGIGPYAAAHCMVLLHDFNHIPIDSEVTAYLLRIGVDPSEAKQYFSHWGEYPFLGYKLGRIVEGKNWAGD